MFSSRSWAEKPRPNRFGELLAVPLLEHAGAGVQAVADVVAVEHEAVDAHRVELVVDQIGHRALAAGAQAGEPDDTAAVAVELFALLAGDGVFVPVDLNLDLVIASFRGSSGILASVIVILASGERLIAQRTPSEPDEVGYSLAVCDRWASDAMAHSLGSLQFLAARLGIMLSLDGIIRLP